MAVFNLTHDMYAYWQFRELLFCPDEEFLTPEDTQGSAVFSPRLQFQIAKERYQNLNEAWIRFVRELEELLGQAPDQEGNCYGGEYFDKHPRRSFYRLAICCVEPLNGPDKDGQSEVMEIPMKVKLISDIPVGAPRVQMEQSYLVRLARVCGPQNVIFRIRGLALNEKDRNKDFRIQMVWNQKDLCWETSVPVPIVFKTEKAQKFGKYQELYVHADKIEFELTNAGVSQVLQRQYEKHGENWQFQLQLLETGEFADMTIFCREAKSEKKAAPLKCHRMVLAGSSPVFAKMLEEGQGQKWEETESRTLHLPESEDAILALLHFLYYGGCDRIFRNQVDIVLELLEAGEKYEIPSLVDVAAFVLLADAKEDNWFTLDDAVALFHFVRLLDGCVWNKLKRRSHQMIQGRKEEHRKESASYQKFYDVATKLGPMFLYILELDYFHSRGNEWKPTSVVNIEGSRVTLDEAEFMYEFLSFGEDFKDPRYVDVGVGIMMLAEFCGKPLPKFARHFARLFFCYNYWAESQLLNVDYAVDLFCTAGRRKGDSWFKLKMGAFKFIKDTMEKHPDKISASTKYKELLQTPDVFEEFSELLGKYKRSNDVDAVF